MTSSTRPDGYELVVGPEGTDWRIRRLAKFRAALLIGFGAFSLLAGSMVLATAASRGRSAAGGIYSIAFGLGFLLAWAWGHFLPAVVFVRDGRLVSRGKWGLRHSARAEDIDGIGIRSRSVFMVWFWQDFYCPYVKLRAGRGFWLFGLTGPVARSAGPAAAQEEAVHNIRHLLRVSSLHDAEQRAANRPSP